MTAEQLDQLCRYVPGLRDTLRETLTEIATAINAHHADLVAAVEVTEQAAVTLIPNPRPPTPGIEP